MARKQMHVRDFSEFANTKTTLSRWSPKIRNRKSRIWGEGGGVEVSKRRGDKRSGMRRTSSTAAAKELEAHRAQMCI